MLRDTPLCCSLQASFHSFGSLTYASHNIITPPIAIIHQNLAVIFFSAVFALGSRFLEVKYHPCASILPLQS